jgi:hypothetical protein
MDPTFHFEELSRMIGAFAEGLKSALSADVTKPKV